MTSLHQRLTLDDYRAHIVAQLKACAEPEQAEEPLSDVETMLASTQTSRSLQKEFWRGLSQDMDALTHQGALLDPAATATLRTVILITRAVTTRALRVLQDVE
jgi:hypothetical protein